MLFLYQPPQCGISPILLRSGCLLLMLSVRLTFQWIKALYIWATFCLTFVLCFIMQHWLHWWHKITGLWTDLPIKGFQMCKRVWLQAATQDAIKNCDHLTWNMKVLKASKCISVKHCSTWRPADFFSEQEWIVVIMEILSKYLFF